ncbi:MAG: hypothetical protein WBM25_10835 [Azonexus sp.]
MATTNDKEFKSRLETLRISQQRQVAALFVQRVFAFSNDVRIKAALDMAMRADISDAELAVVSQAANTARVESYAQCGRDSDWNTQAGLFVAKAAVSCVRPDVDGQNLAWDAAMQVRVARTCEAASGDVTDHKEAEAQYAILDDFLSK